MKSIWVNRGLIWKLSKNDFKERYAGSYLGAVWALVQPVVTVVMYYIVFDKIMGAGFQTGPRATDIPYVLFLTAGLVPWFFFSEAMTQGTAALTRYSFLVKKVVFDVSILPLIKVISAIFVHIFFVFLLFVMCIIYGYSPIPSWIQVIYYSFCLFLLVLGMCYISSSLMVFFKDIAQIIAIALQLGMWATPILWNIEGIGPKAAALVSINPLVYIVNGYRDSIISGIAFWEKPGETIYFWCFTCIILIGGIKLFYRLKPHFADVL